MISTAPYRKPLKNQLQTGKKIHFVREMCSHCIRSAGERLNGCCTKLRDTTLSVKRNTLEKMLKALVSRKIKVKPF